MHLMADRRDTRELCELQAGAIRPWRSQHGKNPDEHILSGRRRGGPCTRSSWPTSPNGLTLWMMPKIPRPRVLNYWTAMAMEVLFVAGGVRLNKRGCGFKRQSPVKRRGFEQKAGET